MRNRQQRQGRRPPQPPAAEPAEPRFQTIDRYKICPFLLRVFIKVGGHHTAEEFAVRGEEPERQFRIYTWSDATLRELTDLVRQVAPEARRRDAILSLAFVYPNRQGRFVAREVGTTFSYPNERRRDSGSKALSELGFEIGDYLDVAIVTDSL